MICGPSRTAAAGNNSGSRRSRGAANGPISTTTPRHPTAGQVAEMLRVPRMRARAIHRPGAGGSTVARRWRTTYNPASLT